jgi:hypothetical protein
VVAGDKVWSSTPNQTLIVRGRKPPYNRLQSLSRLSLMPWLSLDTTTVTVPAHSKSDISGLLFFPFHLSVSSFYRVCMPVYESLCMLLHYRGSITALARETKRLTVEPRHYNHSGVPMIISPFSRPACDAVFRPCLRIHILNSLQHLMHHPRHSVHLLYYPPSRCHQERPHSQPLQSHCCLQLTS